MDNNEALSLRRQVVTLLQGLLDGKLTSSDVLKQWPAVNEDELINIAKHMIEHYDDDFDIRNKDARYAEMQISHIKQFINNLTMNQAIEGELEWYKPRRINFVGYLKKILWK